MAVTACQSHCHAYEAADSLWMNWIIYVCKQILAQRPRRPAATAASTKPNE